MSSSTPRWRKSSHSGDHPSNCLEVAMVDQGIAARDSKDPAGPVLGFAPVEWRGFVDEVKRGTFDLP
ncbi:DUF397 domain-containing protein [Spirillospora sp. NPDC048832]